MARGLEPVLLLVKLASLWRSNEPLSVAARAVIAEVGWDPYVARLVGAALPER